jgi:hypothetical protein
LNKNVKLPVILSVIALLLIALYVSTSFSEKSVIRRTIFLNGHPIQAFTTPIQKKPEYIDNQYGNCYVMESPKLSNGTENAIPGICMNKNKYGFIYQVRIGVD